MQIFTLGLLILHEPPSQNQSRIILLLNHLHLFLTVNFQVSNLQYYLKELKLNSSKNES
jgi:hypothetical protein